MKPKTILVVTAIFLSSGLLAACSDSGDSAASSRQGTAESRGVHPEVWPQIEPPLARDDAMEDAITALMDTMSLADKVGQLIQPEINSVTPDEVKKFRLGSVLNGGGGWPGKNKHSTPADWLALADAYWEASMDTSEGGVAIPIIWGLDAVHGHNNVIGATLFPHNVGLGATRNPDLIRRVGRVTAIEVAVTGQDWDFGPTVAVSRDGRWGRAYESYSEDPEVVASLAPAFVEGIQGELGSPRFLDDHHLIATVKHYLGDGGTVKGVDQGDNVASEEELRDVHGAGYAAAFPAGVQTVMASYNSWHGRKMHGYKELLTDVLKERMGFDGFVVGDWNGHGQVPGCSNDSCAEAINAGLDMFMVPKDWKDLYKNTLKQAEAGEISATRLDDAVRRILRVKFRAGLFDQGKPSSRALGGRFELIGAAEHRAVAREAVRQSLVLLKNNGGLLPLDPQAGVLVAGDGADDIGKQAGGWSVTWQGTGNTNDEFPGASSIWDGIRDHVETAGGVAILSPDGSFESKPDAAIVVFGEEPYAEFQGDRDNIDYRPTDDLELLKRLNESGVPVVAVFLTGRPLWINPELNASDAFVVAWLPGTEGEGVADVLFRKGDGSSRYDFIGKLPVSWPKRANQARLNQGEPDYDPLFALGYGLTYADRAELPALSEDAGELEFVSRTVYFDGGPVFPWRLFVGDEDSPRVAADNPTTSTEGSENLVLRAVDRRVQEDAREARWSGGAPAAVYLAANEPVDLSREANGEMAIAFDVYVERVPGGAVGVRMGCGESCSGTVDVSGRLAALERQEWSTVAVRLRCFEDAGVEMKRIDVPFALMAEEAGALRFSDVRLIAASEGEADCP